MEGFIFPSEKYALVHIRINQSFRSKDGQHIVRHRNHNHQKDFLFHLLTQATGILSLISFCSYRYHIRMAKPSWAKKINLWENKKVQVKRFLILADENELQTRGCELCQLKVTPQYQKIFHLVYLRFKRVKNMLMVHATTWDYGSYCGRNNQIIIT